MADGPSSGSLPPGYDGGGDDRGSACADEEGVHERAGRIYKDVAVADLADFPLGVLTPGGVLLLAEDVCKHGLVVSTEDGFKLVWS